MYNIIFSRKSLENLEDIREYISQDNEKIAEKVINSILNIINYLNIFPKIGFEIGIYRELVEPIYKYNIRYKIKNKDIYIIAIYKFKKYV